MAARFFSNGSLSSDIRFFHELHPQILFTKPAIASLSKQIYQGIYKNYYHYNPAIDLALHKIETAILPNHQNQKNKYDQIIFQNFINQISEITSSIPLENFFTYPINLFIQQKNDLRRFVKILKKNCKRRLIQLPISTARFPHYQSTEIDVFNESSHSLSDIEQEKLNNENLLKKIIEQKSDIFFNDLEIYTDILKKNMIPFYFSPSFILLSINQFEIFLTNFLSKFQTNASKSESHQYFDLFLTIDFDQIEVSQKELIFKYLHQILELMLLLYLMINQLNDVFVILIQCVLIEQKYPEFISFKSLLDDFLPKTQQRTQIISLPNIIDFACSSTYCIVLTSTGLFDYQSNSCKQICIIDFDLSSAKISLIDSVLYCFSLKSKKLFIKNLSNEICELKTIDISNHELIAFDVFDDYLRILQKKVDSNRFLLTIIDQNPQSRLNFDVFDAFSHHFQNNSKIQFEFELNHQYKQITFSKNSLYVLYHDSFFEKYLIGTSKIDKVSHFLSPFYFLKHEECIIKIFNSILYILINHKLIEIDLEKTQYYVRSTDLLFNEYSYLRKLSDLINNCINHIISKEIVIKMTTNYHGIPEQIDFNKNESQFVVSPEEMSLLVQSLPSIERKAKYLIKIINQMENEELKYCLSSLIIKNITISIIYSSNNYYKSKDKIDETELKVFNNIAQFIFDIIQTLNPLKCSQLSKSILNESLLISLGLIGKYFILTPFTANSLYSNTENSIHSYHSDNFHNNEHLHTNSNNVNMNSNSSNMNNCDYVIHKDFDGDNSRNNIDNHLVIQSDTVKSNVGNEKSDNRIHLIHSSSSNENVTFSNECSSNFYDNGLHYIPSSCLNEFEYNELFIHHILNNLNEDNLIKQLSFLLFSYPSSLYIINDKVYSILLENEDEIDLLDLFESSSHFLLLECRFSNYNMNDEFIQYIEPYLQCLFKYANHLLHSQKFAQCQKLLSIILGSTDNNPYYSLMLEKGLVTISSILFESIKPLVKENDDDFYFNNLDLSNQPISKTIKIIESDHPYVHAKLPTVDLSHHLSVNLKKQLNRIEEIATIEFNENVNYIYVEFDNRSELFLNEQIILQVDNNDIKIYDEKYSHWPLNQALRFTGNKIRILLANYNNKQIDSKPDKWGYKITITGIHSEPNLWIPNPYLDFYSVFIFGLTNCFINAYHSTDINKIEKDFSFILDSGIIQGIKLEDIDNYENSLQSNKLKSFKKRRRLTHGISRGIKFDTETEEVYDDEFKKLFLKEMISVDEDSLGHIFLKVMYEKTKKQCKIKLNKNTISIKEIEQHFVACLIKQLGFINSSIQFITNYLEKLKYDENPSKNEFSIPFNLQIVFKYVYKLRNTLFFSYQQTKSFIQKEIDLNLLTKLNLNFSKYSDEIKRKCKLLLYSDPILKFNSLIDDQLIEDTMNSIFSFVTSTIPLSHISTLIDIRRKRLWLSKQSVYTLIKFVKQDLLFHSSRPIFAASCSTFSQVLNCKGLLQSELDDYYKLLGDFAEISIKHIFDEFSVSFIVHQSFIVNFLYESTDIDSKIKCAKHFFNLIEKNRENESFIHTLIDSTFILQILSIISFTKNFDLFQQLISLLNTKIDTQNKRLILITLPYFIQQFDQSQSTFIFDFLENNRGCPIIVKSTFLWIASVLTYTKNSIDSTEFIKTVLTGIGSSFTGHSCLFINDNFDSYSHRQVAESQISFIRYLVNHQYKPCLDVIHSILTNLSQTDLFIQIGVFASLGQYISAFEPQRKISSKILIHQINEIIGFNSSNGQVYLNNSFDRKVFGSFYNTLSFDPNSFTLTEIEVSQILAFHSSKFQSTFFKDQDYSIITENEINECVLICSFYSFLPVILQNSNSVSLLFSKPFLNQTISLFELAMKDLPSNENSILILMHYLEQFIHKKFDINQNTFIKMNHGDISTNHIKSNSLYYNLFFYSRPFDFDCKTYFEVELNKIGQGHFYIGFVDSESYSIDDSFGFGRIGYEKRFCRRSPFLSRHIEFSKDKRMNKHSQNFEICEHDKIGCYYTHDYVYLTKNRKLAKFRIPHGPLKSYLPIIIIDHDDMELKITQNVIILNSNDGFEFLNETEEYFNEFDLNTISPNDRDLNKEGNIKEKRFLVGEQVFISKTKLNPNHSRLENIDAFPKSLLRYRDYYGIIKDIIPSNNRFVSQLKVEVFNNITLTKQIVDVDSRYVKPIKTNFLTILENRTNTKFTTNFGDWPKIKINDKPLIMYLKSKTIKDNSKSISIIMIRYLVFILFDYLRFSKSKFLLDECIDTNEMKIMIKSLAFSLPTITIFNPKLIKHFEQVQYYLIFPDEQKQIDENDNYKPKLALTPGFSYLFHQAFKAFLRKSEKFISGKFISNLLFESFKFAEKDNLLSSSQLYELIPSNSKYENFTPIPLKWKFSENLLKVCTTFDKIQGFVPILITSIPDQLSPIKFGDKAIRYTTDQISEFIRSKDGYTKRIQWAYDIRKKINDENILRKVELSHFSLKFGVVKLDMNLPENLLNGSLGLIQNLFIFIQSVNDSDVLFEKQKRFMSGKFLENLVSLALKRNPLIFPLLQMIIVEFTSKFGLSDSFFSENSSNALTIFAQSNSSELQKLNSFPTYKNESELLMMIYLNLSQSRLIELTAKQTETIFEKYNEINTMLFSINDNKTANLRTLLLTFYYSQLLCNEMNLPYPLFLFAHEWINQHFGGFRVLITKDDFSDFLYTSKTYENDFELICTFTQISLYAFLDSENYQFDLFINQINKNQKIQIEPNTPTQINFPIQVSLEPKNKNPFIPKGTLFIVDFSPSLEDQRRYFVMNYEKFLSDFANFQKLSKYDNELSEKFSNSSVPQKVHHTNRINDYSDDDYSSDDDDLMINYSLYNMNPMPNPNEVTIQKDAENVDSNTNEKVLFNQNVISLRLSILNSYRHLVEEIFIRYKIAENDDSFSQSKSSIKRNIFMHQIIRPAYSMSTDVKFPFIHTILSSEEVGTASIKLIINRFEQQKFLEQFESTEDSLPKITTTRSFMEQFMEQVNEDSLCFLRVPGSNPFNVTLVGEGSVDAGGPAREIFSSLMMEIMNDRLGIFTFNPNRRKNNKDTNQEDLIPNIAFNYDKSVENAEKIGYFSSKRFVYTGALIAVCIVSGLPQPLKLSMIVWEYLTHGYVSIESIYEIDNDFHELIKSIEKVGMSMNNCDSNHSQDELFESIFVHSFEIVDSFGRLIELLPNGSKILVTKDNRNEFIELAKSARVHEFDQALREIKEGFDLVMTYTNITKILRPKELKLLVCGELDCSIDQMKNLIDVSCADDDADEDSLKEIFWQVIEKLSVEERMLFIKFSSGNLGLPAPGLRWETNIQVEIQGPINDNQNSEKNLINAHTCFSTVSIPYFQTEEELEKQIQIAIKFSGLITDQGENFEEIAEYL